MEENSKVQNDGILADAKGTVKTILGQGIESVKKGFKKAAETIAAAFTQSENETVTDEFKNIIAEELMHKLSSYYSGAKPGIGDLIITENSDGKKLSVTAKAVDLKDDSNDIQEADLQADMEMPDPNYYHIPIPGAYGVDIFPTAPLPASYYSPGISKITLTVTNSSKKSEAVLESIEKCLLEKYPQSKLLDRNTLLESEGEILSIKRLVSDMPAGKRKNGKNLIRLVKFSAKKNWNEKAVDECLFIKDYDFCLEPPEDIFAAEFPGPGEIIKTLKKEKTSLRSQVFENIAGGFLGFLGRLFFRIRKPFGKIEPNEGAGEKEISFNIEFDCVSGFGPFSRVVTVSTVIFYEIDPGSGEKEKVQKNNFTGKMIYLRHDDFVINPAGK